MAMLLSSTLRIFAALSPLCCLAQHVGIGTSSPLFPLSVVGTSSVNGRLRIEGNNFLELGAGIAGKEANAGVIGYNIFSTNALTLVGAGTNPSNRQVYFFAEGGTTLSGPLNLGGALRAGGTAGNSGQVLVSQGEATPPLWQHAAYGDPVRFSVTVADAGSAQSGTGIISTTRYNQSPASIIIGAPANTIKLVKGGLYYFDLFVRSQRFFAAAPSAEYPSLSLNLRIENPGGTLLYSRELTANNMLMAAGDARTTWQGSHQAQLTLHLPANSVIMVTYSFSGPASTSNFLFGHLTGHLISP